MKNKKISFTLKIEEEDYNKFLRAAESDRRSLTNWIITTCINKLENENI